MSHNGPNPDRFIANDPTFRALSLVAARYGELFTGEARLAVAYIAPRIAAGMTATEAVDAFEMRPMHERRYGRPAEATVWGYDER